MKTERIAALVAELKSIMDKDSSVVSIGVDTSRKCYVHCYGDFPNVPFEIVDFDHPVCKKQQQATINGVRLFRLLTNAEADALQVPA